MKGKKKLASEMSINHNQRNKFSLVSLHVCNINSNGQRSNLFFLCVYVSHWLASSLSLRCNDFFFCLSHFYFSLDDFKCVTRKYFRFSAVRVLNFIEFCNRAFMLVDIAEMSHWLFGIFMRNVRLCVKWIIGFVSFDFYGLIGC